jgi:8-hydroxy-5-deazaflavin:NADPH oxidoreductase
MIAGKTHRVAIVGGTGAQGQGLGYRFARAGHGVTLGSRDPARAVAAAAEINTRLLDSLGAQKLRGDTNEGAVAAGDVVVLAIPYRGYDAVVAGLPLSGKIVISCVNPVAFDSFGPIGLAIDGGLSSAAEQAQRLQPESHVVGAFHHLAAVSLSSGADYLAGEDVLVVSDSAQAKAVASQLAETITGRPGIDAGRLRMARHLEALTAVLISINKSYKTHAGIRIHGLDGAASTGRGATLDG